jgi:PEGA domain-containing protein
MKRLMVTTTFVVFLLSTKSHAQSGAAIPQSDGGHASQASCVILKRMGRIDRTKSRLYSLGISGKQFRYVEGKLPEGFSPHGRLTDHDVRNLQARGAQVLVLDSHYTPEDLKEARANCAGPAGKTANQIEAKASPAPAPALIASIPAPASKPLTAKVSTPKADDSASPTGTAELAASTPLPAPKPPTAKAPAPKAHDLPRSADTTEAALLDVSSTPTEADVYIDERLSGRTPATLILMPGDHKLVIKKNGFVVWKRKFNLPSGRSIVDADLVPKAK